GDQGRRPAHAAREAQGRLRRARAGGRPHRPDTARGPGGSHRPADGAHLRPPRGPVTPAKRPLLAIDRHSLAHRADPALPKSMTSAKGRPSGAIVGFSNFVLRLWQAEAPRAVVVGWDSL